MNTSEILESDSCQVSKFPMSSQAAKGTNIHSGDFLKKETSATFLATDK